MRRLNIRSAALASAAVCALLVACKAPDNADSGRRAAKDAPRAAADISRPAPAHRTPAGPAAPKTDAHGHADTGRRVSVGELQQMLARNEAVAVDVRSPESYRESHIKGALLMPGEEVAARAKELPKDKLIVFYCA